MEKVSLRKMDWPDIIAYFSLLPSKENFASKDLVDYFQFKYLNQTSLNMWVSPNYLRQTSAAKKILSLYGKDLSIGLIDTMFLKYREVFGKEFNQIIWSLGVLSSEKTGWLVEKILLEYQKKVKEDRLSFKNKPRSEWSFEEREVYEKELTNGTA